MIYRNIVTMRRFGGKNQFIYKFTVEHKAADFICIEQICAELNCDDTHTMHPLFFRNSTIESLVQQYRRINIRYLGAA